MAREPKRKSPERGPQRGKRPAPSRAARILLASGAAIGRHPRSIGGFVAFGVIFSFVAANALWYQPRHHPAPLLATRMFEDAKTTRAMPEVADEEPGVTTFRIERQSDEQPTQAAEKPEPSPLIREIQVALAGRGLYDGPADGLTGPKTEAAILFFEQTEGMAETGEASKALLARLKHVATPADDAGVKTASTKVEKPLDEVAALISQADDPGIRVIPEKKPASPALVMQIQKGLSGMAYADVKVDGIPGEATRTAIRAFEKSYRLPVTGEPSERLLKKLKSIGAI
ncbi:peptidoglycan-binding domain-containing protein [Rhizobium sp. LjRoot254]|uniref:peptidoglycan-binding domain-containing protein n=1 Tax=Rhizobium sp. LjRoot254 TaxID=3342297 RepID=UPI003ECEE1C4